MNLLTPKRNKITETTIFVTRVYNNIALSTATFTSKKGLKMKSKEEVVTMGKLSHKATSDEAGGKEFITFLQACSDALNRGDSVQAIWSDFLRSEK